MPIINFLNVTKVMHNTQPIQKIYAGAVLVWEKPKKRVTQDFYTYFYKLYGKWVMYVGNNQFEQASEFVVGVITPYNGEFRLKLGALRHPYIEVVSYVSLSGQQLPNISSGRYQLIYEI
ncbi:hypothetical protein NF419_04540 [Streptococcus suis]|nr:hypothetical protein [Streptococcus suis]